jgi:hypothetical protein
MTAPLALDLASFGLSRIFWKTLLQLKPQGVNSKTTPRSIVVP